MIDAVTLSTWIGALGLATTTRQDSTGVAVDMWLAPVTAGDPVATITVGGPSLSLVAHERRLPKASLAATWSGPDLAREPLVVVTVAAVQVAAGFALVTATVRDGGENILVRFEAPLHHDGVTEQAFLLTVSNVIKAGQVFEGVAPSQAKEVVVASGSVAEAGVRQPGPSAEGHVQTSAGDAPISAAATPASQTTPAASSWTPTHVVPAGGLPAWQAPDPASPQQLLAPSLPVQVVEIRGDWARVIAVNGWSGWVDGRRLAPGA